MDAVPSVGWAYPLNWPENNCCGVCDPAATDRGAAGNSSETVRFTSKQFRSKYGPPDQQGGRKANSNPHSLIHGSSTKTKRNRDRINSNVLKKRGTRLLPKSHLLLARGFGHGDWLLLYRDARASASSPARKSVNESSLSLAH